MREVRDTAIRKVSVLGWTVDHFSSLEVVVNVLYVVDRIEEQINWLSSG